MNKILSQIITCFLVTALICTLIPCTVLADDIDVKFASDYSGIAVFKGDTFKIDVKLTGSTDAKLYIAGQLVDSTPESAVGPASGGTHSFEVNTASVKAVGECEMKVVAGTASDSATIHLVTANGNVNTRVENFENVNFGEGEVTYGTALTADNFKYADGTQTIYNVTGASLYDGKTTAMGTNNTNMLKIVGDNSYIIDAFPGTSTLKSVEIEFDYYSTYNSAGHVGIEARPYNNDACYKFVEGGNVRIYPIQSGKFYKRAKDTSIRSKTSNWYHFKFTTIRDVDDSDGKYAVYIDDYLYDFGTLDEQKAGGTKTLHLLFSSMSSASRVRYVDNLVIKEYESSAISYDITSCKIGETEYAVENSQINSETTSLSATLSKEVTFTEAKIEGENVSEGGTNVTVEGTTVTATMPQGLPAGDYKISLKIDDNNYVYIPFTVAAKPDEITFEGITDGGTIDITNEALEISSLVTAPNTEAKLYIDGVEAGSTTSSFVYGADFALNVSNLYLGEHSLKITCGTDEKEINVKFVKNNVVTTDLQDFENVTDEFLGEAAANGLYYAQQSRNGTYKKLVPTLGNHTNAAGIWAPATVGNGVTGRSSILYLSNTSGHGSVSVLNDNVAVEFDLYVQDKNDDFYFSFEWNRSVLEGEDVKSGTKALRVNFYPDGVGEGNFITGGKICGAYSVENETWYNIKLDFSIKNQTVTTYVNDKPIKTAAFGNIGFGTTYYKADGTTKLTVEDLQINKIDALSTVILVHKKDRSVVATEEHMLYAVDNIRSTVYNPVPMINTYAPAYFNNTRSAFEVTLDRNYSNTNAKENIKLFADGAETEYESVTFEGKVAKFVLSAPIVGDSVSVEFGSALLLEDGTTAAGVRNKVSLIKSIKTYNDMLYIAPVIEGEKLYLKGYNAGEAFDARIITASYSGNQVLDVYTDVISLGGHFSLDSGEVEGDNDVKCYLWHGDSISPLTDPISK